MDRGEVRELFYITAIENLPSIVQIGILSHNAAKKVKGHRSVADEEVNERRARVRVPNGLSLHDYVNFYFCPRNGMLRRLLGDGLLDELCVLGVRHEVLDLDDVVVSDRNAAVSGARFAPVSEGLVLLDRELVFAKYWTDPDPIEKHRKMAAMQAEALVPNVVPPDCINGAYVGSAAALAACQAQGLGLAIRNDNYMFFK